MPPSTKITTTPITKRSGVDHRIRPIQSVEIQAKIWMPLGMAMNRLATVNKADASRGMPVANMLCTHSPKHTQPVAASDATTHGYPKMGRRAGVATNVDNTATAGTNRLVTFGVPEN